MSKKRLIATTLIVLGILAAVSGYVLWDQLARAGDPAAFEEPEEHFKYGGIGLNRGFPLYLWAVMPDVFADLLPEPGGWEVFGFIDEGRGYPVGFANQTVGFPGLTPNCALCHAGSYRSTADADSVVVPGAPAHSLDFQAFNRFVFATAADPRFNAKTLMPAINGRFELSRVERFVYRYLLLPATRKKVRKQAEEAAWMDTRPDSGRGKFDAFNLFKIDVLGLPDDGSDGRSDFTSLYNLRARDGQYFHWNGSGNDLHQELLMSAYPLNLGASGFLADSLARVGEYLHDLAPPAFPFDVNTELAAAGERIFDEHCSSCHAANGERVGRVTAQAEVGTDPQFLGMWTEKFVQRLQAIDEPPFVFPGLRITDGYLNVPLDGVWIRAPYLHNGSVPTLTALLQTPELRPAVFYRGNHLYDPVEMGFVHTESGQPGQSLTDTSDSGNGNAGHVYGTDLEPGQKLQLIEFLKTL